MYVHTLLPNTFHTIGTYFRSPRLLVCPTPTSLSEKTLEILPLISTIIVNYTTALSNVLRTNPSFS